MTEHSNSELRSLHFSWTSTCLTGNLPSTDTSGGVAQLLTVLIDNVDGRILPEPVGFRLSFRHHPIPQLLRLSSLLNNTHDPELPDDWRDPPSHLRIELSELIDNLHSQVDSAQEQNFVKHEIEELRVLQSQVKEIQSQAKELRDIIRTKEKVISNHLGKDVFTLKEQIDQCDSISCVLKAIVHKAHGAIKNTYARLSHENTSVQTAFMASTPDSHRNETRAPEASSPNDSEQQDSEPRLSKGTIFGLAAIPAVLCCGGIFIVIRGCCCSSRSKIKHIESNPDPHTIRNEKKAHRRRRWREWWHRRSRRADYEEKRLLVLEQEGLLEEVLQEDIRQLQNAHAFVTRLVLAEESGHRQSGVQSHVQQVVRNTSRRSSNASDGFLQPLSRTSSLPSYTSEPGSAGLPAYEEHGDETGIVANGFAQYTPSSSSTRHWSAQSSIIDISPRQSTESMRTKHEEYENEDKHEDREQQDYNGV